jgi:hypothetical protein
MTDRKDALVDLLDKVEAGNFKWNAWADPPLDRALMGKVEDSYYGSLDAAKALHEAVLTEWRVTHAFGLISGEVAKFNLTHNEKPSTYVRAESSNPARAWLIAILKALIAGENTNDNLKGDD